MPKLTSAAVERLNPDPLKRLEVPDSILPGLYLVVQPSGAKSWAVRYRHQGRTRKYTLGTLAVLPLATAREKGREALQAAASGRDPSSGRKLALSTEQDGARSVIAEFINRHVRANNKRRTAEEVERLFKLHVLPAWSSHRIQEITRRDVVALLDSIVDAGKPVAANRTFASVRKLFNWCLERGIVEASPCDRVRTPIVEASRDRVLSDDELGLVWKAAEQIGWPFGTMTKVLLLTGQRRDEVAGMRRSEVRNGLWTIPASRTKNGLPHEVPLAGLVQDLVAKSPQLAGKDFVFSTNGETPVSGFSKSKSRIERVMLQILRERARPSADGETEPDPPAWRLHDLRRTLASGLARLGEPIHVIEAILNHRGGAISGVAAIYNRHSYRQEKAAALDRWATHLNRMTGGPGEND